MAAPMRDSPLDGGHRAKVADPRTAAAAAAAAASNFEYDDNEWDIGIGDLIIDLDADIEKTNEKAAGGMSSSAANSGGGGKGAKMAVEHSATVDKGLKMKIKRTKPGTKTSEAKHEIVKTGEQNGAGDAGGKHAATSAGAASGAGGAANTLGGSSKRGSSGHRRDKARDKHGEKGVQQKPPQTPSTAPTPPPTVTAPPDVNGVVVRQNSAPPPSPAAASATVVPVVSQQQQTTAATPAAPPPTSSQQSHHHQPPQQQPPPQAPPPRVVFPVAAGPGPGPPLMNATPNAPGPPQAVVASAASQAGTAAVPSTAALVSVKVEAYKGAASSQVDSMDDSASMSPPAKKLKSEPKDMLDVCVGTSVGTITEPDCLGPCEPGTSVTLEGIVWHETEGGVLVVNVTWRGKTYVGTLLDCTRHDWAPPRFCDSPTSDLDARLPKGRGKRGRAAASTTPGNDLSNFTETRSSVHSKLRNGGAKGRRGGSTGTGPSSGTTAGTGSPTPFVPPRSETNNKRKGRSPEEESPSSSKKNRAPQPPAPSGVAGNGSPPSSPVLLECPEPNCSKKYKHINGLKYHQSHAHGSAEDEDTKDAASTSENDESNAEAPSPAPSLKSPEKGTAPEPRKEELSNGAVAPQGGTASPPAVVLPEPPSQPATPPQELVTPPAPAVAAAPSPDPKSLVKPGVLRFGPPVEDFSVGVFCNNKPATISTGPVSSAPVSTIRAVNVAVASGQTPPPQVQPQQPPPTQVQQVPPTQVLQQPLPVSKPPQFKVKPTASLMPDDKKDRNKLPGHKKKNRKSPAGSPHPQPEQPTFGLDAASGREDVQSPAYSDISDDAAPVLESEVGSDGKAKGQGPDKKGDAVVGGQGPSPHSIPPYGMYPFFSQPPYLVPSVQQDGKPKESVGVVDKHSESKVGGEKEKKDVSGSASEYSQKLLQQHYYPYGYVPGYGYNLEPNYPMAVIPPEDKVKDSPGKDDKSPSPVDHGKASLPTAPSPIQVPNPAKIKAEAGVGMKEKHQNDNHQILKESIEMKNQMNSYVYSRQQQQQQQQQEDLRRYYLYPEQQRRKDPGSGAELNKASGPPPKQTLPSPGHKHKDKGHGEDKKEDKVKQEGVKPTMETQGPPPPPTSSYAYIHHPGYMQAPPYGALPFDPGHAVYRSVLVPGYGAAPYLHPPLSRYPHAAPEDLSRPPPSAPTKALDLLQHHASQYYSSHKIHELQERALKSPTPKGVSGGGPGTAVSSASPSGVAGGGGPSPGHGQQQQSGGPTSVGAAPGVGGGGPNVVQASGKQQASSGEGKEARSPPPQRHVHTHHHTHVGLGYPILASQYPAPYGAAVLASQQAAAVAATVINPYPPK